MWGSFHAPALIKMETAATFMSLITATMKRKYINTDLRESAATQTTCVGDLVLAISPGSAAAGVHGVAKRSSSLPPITQIGAVSTFG